MSIVAASCNGGGHGTLGVGIGLVIAERRENCMPPLCLAGLSGSGSGCFGFFNP